MELPLSPLEGEMSAEPTKGGATERDLSAVSPNRQVFITACTILLRRLPEEQRRAIVLHHVADLPVAQVAAETGAPVGTVKARLSRGRTALAELLGEHQDELTEGAGHA